MTTYVLGYLKAVSIRKCLTVEVLEPLKAIMGQWGERGSDGGGGVGGGGAGSVRWPGISRTPPDARGGAPCVEAQGKQWLINFLIN